MPIEQGDAVAGDTDSLFPEEKPWRKGLDDFSEKGLEVLKDFVKEHKPLEVKQVRILMVGEIGAGKSSFFNTINSIYRGHVTAQAATGSDTHSLTTNYRSYEIRSGREGKDMNFRLCDTMGLEDANQGLDVTDFYNLLDGHVPESFTFIAGQRLEDSIQITRAAGLEDRVHVLAIFIDAVTIDNMSHGIVAKLHEIKRLAIEHCIPVVVVLAHIDKVCEAVKVDISQVYRSRAVCQCVKTAAELIQVAVSQVVAVKNYETETELDRAVDIVALFALRQMLRLADNFFDEYMNKPDSALAAPEHVTRNSIWTVESQVQIEYLRDERPCTKLASDLGPDDLYTTIPTEECSLMQQLREPVEMEVQWKPRATSTTSQNASSDPTEPWRSLWQWAALTPGKVYKMPNHNGQFASPDEIVKWLLGGFDDRSNVPSDVEELDKCLPVWKPDFEMLADPITSGIRVTWIGHSTLLVQIDGITILTDPVFSRRCSSTLLPGPKRYRDVPCNVEDLPRIDAVIISNNHYDHVDKASVKQLLAKCYGNSIHWFVPEELKDWMQKQGCLQENVTQSDWWQVNQLPRYEGVTFTFTPTQHWGGHGTIDRNTVLWGSWCVNSWKHSFYFTGDTGYCDVFKVIGEKYGPFDLAAIPIGGYEPRDVMQYQHINPFEAVQIHQELKAKHSIGIHWGTFKLTNEPYLDPFLKLNEALSRAGLTEEDFFTLDHGQSGTITTHTVANKHTLTRPEPKCRYNTDSGKSGFWSRILEKNKAIEYFAENFQASSQWSPMQNVSWTCFN